MNGLGLLIQSLGLLIPTAGEFIPTIEEFLKGLVLLIKGIGLLIKGSKFRDDQNSYILDPLDPQKYPWSTLAKKRPKSN